MTEQYTAGVSLLYFRHNIGFPGLWLSFRYWALNGHEAWVVPSTFSTSSPVVNQQALAYVATTVPSPSPASYPAAADILWRPAPGDPTTLPSDNEYGTLIASLDPWVGQTVYVVFAVATTDYTILLGVDDIRISPWRSCLAD